MSREGYRPQTPEAKEHRAWQLEHTGTVHAGTQLRKEAAAQRDEDERMREARSASRDREREAVSAPEQPMPSSAQISAWLKELWTAEPGKHHCYVGDGRDLPGLVAKQRAEQAREKGRER